MLNIVIFGPPGAGKGTQAELIANELKLIHISSGDLLRQELANGDLGQEIKKYQDAGELVPDSLVIKMVEKAIAQNLDKPGFIFDGYPRNLNQAVSLDTVLKTGRLELNAVLNLELDEQEAVNRIILRGQTSGRSDDNEETIKARFQTYQEKTLPLLDYYRRQNLLVNIDGRPTISEVTKQIMKILKK